VLGKLRSEMSYSSGPNPETFATALANQIEQQDLAHVVDESRYKQHIRSGLCNHERNVVGALRRRDQDVAAWPLVALVHR
jgi:hypothetical protein